MILFFAASGTRLEPETIGSSMLPTRSKIPRLFYFPTDRLMRQRKNMNQEPTYCAVPKFLQCRTLNHATNPGLQILMW
jgi:hypothetical protein